MALDDSVLSELLEMFRAGDGLDLIRESVRLVVQELIETEASELIGARRYERTEARQTERNGHRPRLLATQAGDVELKIPKLRAGSFFPSLLEPRRRIDQALYAVIAQAYVEGISTRSVDDLVQAMGIASGISRSEVSRICRRLDVQVSAFKDRALGHVAFPYLFLDATYLKVRDPDLHQVVSKAVVVATGITTAGDREVLGLAVGDSEAETFWAEFLRSLRNRGLGGVRLVVSDAHDGLTKAVRRNLQGASWQRCRVHFTRNVLAKVPKASADMVAAALRTVFAHPDPVEVASAWDRVADTFSSQFPKVTDLMNQAKADVLAFSAFPFEHWRKIWSTNPLERVNKEIKRRADVVGIFPMTTPSCASSGLSWLNSTTTGPHNATTFLKAPWLKSARGAILKTSQCQSSSLSADGTEGHLKAHHSVGRHPE